MKAKYFTYRGDVKALAVAGSALVFVTAHPEGQATALYRLDPQELTLGARPFPVGGRVLLAADDGLWVAGTDGQLYHAPLEGGDPAARGAKFAEPPVALSALAGGRLAVATGAQVAVVARGDGKVVQTLDLTDPVTCLASDPTGRWLAAGTIKGTVAVFECETNAGTFQLSDSAALHEAAVTALLFEADDLRFLSAGADQKLLSTHARGALEAEDRGRGANHAEPIAALVAGPAGRFLTGSRDSSLKAWPRGRGTRSVTLAEGLGKVVALAVVPVHGKPQAVAACEDNTLRFFELDEEGKFGEPTVRVHGADGWAKHELGQDDPKRRESALRAVAGFADADAIKRIYHQMNNDADHALRVLACELLGESKHPQAGKALEKALTHKDGAVRISAFAGLRRHAEPGSLRPLVLALKAEHADVGQRAVDALAELALKDDQARGRLVKALGAKAPEVRRSALAGLERLGGSRSPEASLTALASEHADLRRLALLRLYKRKLLHDGRVHAALRWRVNDGDAEVRRIAFLLSLHTSDKLLRTLRGKDRELSRQVAELEAAAEATGA